MVSLLHLMGSVPRLCHVVGLMCGCFSCRKSDGGIAIFHCAGSVICWSRWFVVWCCRCGASFCTPGVPLLVSCALHMLIRVAKITTSSAIEAQTTNKEVALNDKEDRKREVEEKLQILNARKHNLVQVLKQILNAEEELKRRSSMQGLVVQPSISLQVDVTNDSGSMTRHLTPQMGSDGNSGGDAEGGEVDDASNHNMHSCHLLRMSSMSPSSDSPYRRPSHSVVPHTSRAALGASASPSRFAPGSQQGHPANLPPVCVSGMNYIASSPSPAASGGTSVFRDAQHSSPWN